MMKWGKKKKPSSTSSLSSNYLISHVLPRSWLSKFKQTSEKTCSKIPKNNPNDKMKNENVEKSSPRSVSSLQRDSNYYKDEDGFWRLSFGEDNMGFGTKFAVHKPYWGNCKTNVKEVASKKRVLKEVKKVPREMIVREKDRVVKEAAKEEILQRTYKRIMEATEELHKELDEVNGYRKSVEKELSEQQELWRDFDGGNVAKSNWQNLKDAKIREIMSKNEKQRKSFHISREMNKQSNFKGRVRSPRTPSKTETCRIRALEDMKKAKLKKKAKEIEQEEKEVTFGSFAVVKRSCDPQQDFKESMVEMILEKRIKRPEELEELLACYLTLNSDEYHDLIVKVFREVWCELEESYCN